MLAETNSLFKGFVLGGGEVKNQESRTLIAKGFLVYMNVVSTRQMLYRGLGTYWVLLTWVNIKLFHNE